MVDMTSDIIVDRNRDPGMLSSCREWDDAHRIFSVKTLALAIVRTVSDSDAAVIAAAAAAKGDSALSPVPPEDGAATRLVMSSRSLTAASIRRPTLAMPVSTFAMNSCLASSFSSSSSMSESASMSVLILLFSSFVVSLTSCPTTAVMYAFTSFENDFFLSKYVFSTDGLIVLYAPMSAWTN